ncbi:hypothetical protein NIES4071_56790 [Calothrix sp. NIES-4071]|nr:hypothetical protein NIES4071_56790 [Calothrix sp. NIES-4071]BAZ59986.1 hypothetical protein NIES4105_56740 [Calothrix sp. NIES-4105]
MTEDVSQRIGKLITALSQKLELTSIEIADILWLLKHQDNAEASSNVPSVPEIKSETDTKPSSSAPPSQTAVETPPIEPKVEVYTEGNRTTSGSGNFQPIPLPDAPSLRQPLQLARALRPLMQKISSGSKKVLDEQATVNLTAEQKIFIPVFKKALEPWFDLVLVVDESESMIFWRKTIREFQKLLEQCGAFRDVRTWGLIYKEDKVVLQRGVSKKRPHRYYNPPELIDPSGRSLILIVSDCVDKIWRNGKAVSVIEMWVKHSPVAIVQMLPEWMWLRTGLSLGAKVQFGNSAPGVPNQSLLIKEILLWDSINFATGIKVPVLTLEPEVARTWSEMVAGKSYARATGFVFPSEFEPLEDELDKDFQTEDSNYEQQANSFRLTSSPMARKLASLLSAAPVITLPIVHIIQKELLQESQQVHVAEVFLGGIIKPLGGITPDTNPDNIRFIFIDEQIRDNFQEAASEQSSLKVFDAVSKHFAERLGKSINQFYALLRKPELAEIDGVETKAFAQISAKVLKRLGGIYARIASEIEEQWEQVTQAEINGKKVLLKPFTFDVATVEVKKVGRRKPQIIITKNPHSSRYFIEYLPNNVTLDMVEIPGGAFLMGAPKTEKESTDDERPQHEVTVPPFFMGKYTITQAQWRAVATLPQVNRELDPDPSYFKEEKGENLPVEYVTWYDAVEFCDRLSKYTGKNYRLPSEAEWEYACRAGTTTPFHFGETITPELANYDGSETYGSGSKGEFREKTTPVGSFQIANMFGLFDMHGNVWEWCNDDWHDSYEDAPVDGSSWLDEKLTKNDNDNTFKLLRGGSWTSFLYTVVRRVASTAASTTTLVFGLWLVERGLFNSLHFCPLLFALF